MHVCRTTPFKDRAKGRSAFEVGTMEFAETVIVRTKASTFLKAGVKPFDAW
jgi:hypothetical protein